MNIVQEFNNDQELLKSVIPKETWMSECEVETKVHFPMNFLKSKDQKMALINY